MMGELLRDYDNEGIYFSHFLGTEIMGGFLRDKNNGWI